MKVKRFARVMALSLSLALAVPSVVPGAALTAEAASKSVTLTKGSKKTLSVSTDKKVTWKSSKTSVATVSKKGVVKALKAGKTTITATYGSTKKTWKVTVPNIRLNKKKVTINAADATTTLSENPQLRVLGLDEAQQKEVTWDSSNTRVVTIETDTESPAAAILTGKKAGTATVTAQYKNVKMTCEVTVSKTGNRQDPEVYPSQARVYNAEDNTAGVLTPRQAGKWNDVTLETLDAEFISYVDASKAYLEVPMLESYYTYRLTIKGKALGEVKNPIAGQTVDELNYWPGVESVNIYYEMVSEGADSGACFYFASNNDNERYGNKTAAGGEFAKTGVLWANGRGVLQLNCAKSDGSFVFYRDIVTAKPIKEIYVRYIGVTKPYGKEAENPDAAQLGYNANSGWVKWPTIDTSNNTWTIQ